MIFRLATSASAVGSGGRVQAGVQAEKEESCNSLVFGVVGIVPGRLPKLNVVGSIPISRSNFAHRTDQPKTTVRLR